MEKEADIASTTTNAMFNGGKMNHVFEFNKETKRYEIDGTPSSPEAEEALLYGKLYYKIDGSNGMIQVVLEDSQDNDTANPQRFRIYQRLDTKGKEPTNSTALIPLPAGKNPSSYPGHSYYYDEITIANIQGKKLLKRNKAMLDLVQRHAEELVSLGREFVSCEWVGQMFNKTPNVDYPIALALHEQQQVDTTTEKEIDRSYEGMRHFLLEQCSEEPVEGFILEHKGIFYKIRADCFALSEGEKVPFKVNRGKGRPPIVLA